MALAIKFRSTELCQSDLYVSGLCVKQAQGSRWQVVCVKAGSVCQGRLSGYEGRKITEILRGLLGLSVLAFLHPPMTLMSLILKTNRRSAETPAAIPFMT